MIFLDSNVFLRHLAPHATPQDIERGVLADALFDAVRQGHQIATTSEVVLHEVCFVLTAPRHYRYAPATVAPVVGRVIQYRGFRFPPSELDLYLRAFDLMAEQEQLGFADAVIAARCEAAGHDLATFDHHFDAIETISRWPWIPATV